MRIIAVGFCALVAAIAIVGAAVAQGSFLDGLRNESLFQQQIEKYLQADARAADPAFEAEQRIKHGHSNLRCSLMLPDRVGEPAQNPVPIGFRRSEI